MMSWLDDAELLRAHRFHKLDDQQSFVLAHALRRVALSGFLQIPAHRVSLGSTASGLPVLQGHHVNRPFFTHSRTRGYAACAVTELGPVGIDIEALRSSEVDFDVLSSLVALPEGAYCGAELTPEVVGQFYVYWTLLEAYWKAVGTGLPLPGHKIRLTTGPKGQYKIAGPPDTASAAGAVAIPVNCVAGSVMSLVTTSQQAASPYQIILYRGLADFPWSRSAI